MVAVEVKATRRLPRVRSERVRPPGYFTTRDAADEDWLEWDDLVERIQLDAPSQGSWDWRQGLLRLPHSASERGRIEP